MTPPSSASGPEPAAAKSAVEDEWTFVKPRKSRRNQPPSTSHAPSPTSPAPASQTGPLRPVSDIAAEYRTLRAAWESSPAGRSLRALVAAHAAAAAPVTQAVCLGIGTFDPVDGGWEARRRTFVQLIAFLVMVDELGTSPPCPLGFCIVSRECGKLTWRIGRDRAGGQQKALLLPGTHLHGHGHGLHHQSRPQRRRVASRVRASRQVDTGFRCAPLSSDLRTRAQKRPTRRVCRHGLGRLGPSLARRRSS